PHSHLHSFPTRRSSDLYSGLTDGQHTFQVRAVDKAGNTDLSPASFSWLVDTTPPETSITSHPTDPSGSSSASFEFGGTDPAPDRDRKSTRLNSSHVSIS